MAQHKNYWSCSKLADWIRGTKKLHSGTSKEWNAWTILAQESFPKRYWIAEELLDNIQDFITWPVRKLYDIKYYINNRWVTRAHALTAHRKDIKPGAWCDLSDRILFCLFNELVEFVEIEAAHSWIAWNPKEHKKYKAPFWSSGWWRWRVWRCPAAGLANLNWQAALTDAPNTQVASAKEILELYLWWTVARVNRPDPYDASGWSEYSETRRAKRAGKRDLMLDFDDDSEAGKADRELTKVMLDKLHDLEEQYRIEDEEMVIRLIKIRGGLWT